MNRSTKRLLVLGLAAASLVLCGLAFSVPIRPKNQAAEPAQGSNSLESWRRLALVDERGSIPDGALTRAFAQKAALAPPKSASAAQWVEQGPNNLAGRTRCLVISPTNPLTMWMGAAGGGVWRSYDGGTTWNPVGDQLASMAVNALALDPNNATTLYAGTGEGYYNSDAIGGLGIFKSTDSGTTWNLLPATATFAHVNRIAIDPANSQIILATVQDGGIYRTTDGGGTWNQVLVARSGQAVAFCASNPTRVIGSILDYNGGSGNWYAAAVLSTDTGKTWTKATGALGNLVGMERIEPFPLIGDASTVYASVSDGNVWKSTDGGATYSEVTTSSPSDASLAANSIWVDPTNSKHLVVGGQSVFSSTDGGVNLLLIGQGSIQGLQPHPGIHCIVASPAYNGTSNKSVYVCTGGGLFQAPDITTASTGLGWLPHYQGARTSQYNSIAGDATSGLILGGLQDNGTQLLSEGLFQSNDITGSLGLDGGYVVIDPTNSSNMYGELGNLQVFQSTDRGIDVQTITGGLTDATTGSCNYIAPLIIDPNNPKVLLAGGSSLWRCGNAGSSKPTWTAIRPPDSAFISAIAVAPGNSGLIWVGQNDGTIAMTANGTSSQPTWTTISGPKTTSSIPNRYITRILVDSSNSNVVYVTLGGFAANNVWESTDLGATWTSIAGSGKSALPLAPIRAIARNPASPNTLYVGTEVGIFSTSDGGQTWTTSSDLTVNVSVDDLTYMNGSNTLLAATHGRGVWILPAGATTITSLTLSPSTVLGGDSVQGTVTLSQVASAGGATVKLSVNSGDAQVPLSVTVPAGSLSATFTVTTTGIPGTETISVLAALGSSQKSASLTITPSVLSSLVLTPNTVVGGNPVSATVSLNGAAPAGGVIITLSASSGQAIPPGSISIPAGSQSATFQIQTSGVATQIVPTITAIQGSNTTAATLTIQPATLQSFTISPSTVAGGNAAIGTVTLNGKAPFSGGVIGLSSNSKNAIVPATMTIASGQTSGTVSVGTLVVTKTSVVSITAMQGALSKVAPLQVTPTGIQSVSCSPGTVIGGSNVAVTGTVTFTGPTPTTGETVLLTSSSPKVVSIPASVKVMAGKTSATFVVNHHSVLSTETVTLKATSGGVTQTGTLTVNPFQISSVTVSPSTTIGGSTVAGVVTLNATVGTRNGPVSVKLSPNTVAAKMPTAVSVFASTSSAKFTVITSSVGSATIATLTGALGASIQHATLAIEPPGIASLTIKPSTVKGSSTTAVVGTITLTGPAPTGGLTVSLQSSVESVTAPSEVLIPAGKTSGTFKIGHKAVTQSQSASITALANGTSKSATLTVTP